MLQLGASFPTTGCELRRRRNNRTAQDAEGGGGQEGGLAQASTQEVELRQWVWWDRRLLWAGPCFSSLPFQVFQQEKEGDEVGVGQGAE